MYATNSNSISKERPSSPPDRAAEAVEVSVIVPCYNAADTLGEQLESLAAQTWTGSWEVIVADNGSTDESRTVANRYRDALPLRVVEASDIQGAAHARNRGAAVSTGALLLFCDADDVVHLGYVDAMVDALREHPFVGGHERQDMINAEWLQARARTNNKEGGLIRSGHLPFVGGSTIGVRRSVFDLVGGFDESVQCVEDMDFAWRLAEEGITPTYVPEAQFYYRARPTLWGNMIQEYAIARNFMKAHRRHRHEYLVEATPARYLFRQCRPLIRRGLTVRTWGDLLLWCRQVAWTWGLAYEGWAGTPASSEPDVSVNTVRSSSSA